jgi:acetyl-CoA carboxylase biotin carboxyl carrier protein
MAETEFDSDLVRKLAELLEETGLSEIEYAAGDLRVRVARNAVAAPVAIAPRTEPLPGPAAAHEEPLHPGAVTAPMVGTVYLSPEPGAEPFVRVGSTVVEGETLLLLEAMKTFNEVRAPRAGKVIRLLVADGTPVEYGEPLVILE